MTRKSWVDKVPYELFCFRAKLGVKDQYTLFLKNILRFKAYKGNISAREVRKVPLKKRVLYYKVASIRK